MRLARVCFASDVSPLGLALDFYSRGFLVQSGLLRRGYLSPFKRNQIEDADVVQLLRDCCHSTEDHHIVFSVNASAVSRAHSGKVEFGDLDRDWLPSELVQIEEPGVVQSI